MTSHDDLSGIAHELANLCLDCRPATKCSYCREQVDRIEAALRLQREAGRHEGDLALTHHAAEETQKRLSAEADVLRLRTALQTYGQHKKGCSILQRSDYDCTCGFTAVSEGGTDVTPR
jgi:hypothetical protein